MAKSPVTILFTTDSVELAIKDGVATTVNSRGFITVGVDGSGDAQFILVDTSGRQVIVGAGVAGTPAGGVVSVQGVAGGTDLPISVASLPLPSGAATEATLATRLAEATFTARINTQGQKAMAASTPVVLASDQSAIPVTDNGGSLTVDGTVTANQGNQGTHAQRWMVGLSDGSGFISPATDRTTAGAPFSFRLSDGTAFYDAAKTGQLPAALVGGRLDTNNGAWLGSTAPTVGSKTSANSIPVVIASDQAAVQVTGSLVDNAAFTDGTTRVHPVGFIFDEVAGTALTENDAAAARIDAKRAQVQVIEDGTTRGVRAAVKAASTAAVATDPALVVAVSPNNTIPISAASLPLPTGAATSALQTTGNTSLSNIDGKLPATLVGGRLDTNTGAWLGSTAPTVGQKAMASSIPIVIASDQSAVPVSQNGTWTVQQGTPPWSVSQSGTWTVQQGTPPWSVVGPGASGAALSGNPVRIAFSDGTNTRDALSDTSGRLQVVGAAASGAAAAGNPVLAAGSDGTNARTIRTATDGTVRVDPTGTTAQPVTDNGGSLTVDTPQLPAALVGGRLDENVGAWLGSTAPTVGQKAMASSVPVVIASDQSEVQVKQGTAAALSGAWPVKHTDGTNTMPTMDVASRAAFVKQTDGTNVMPTGDVVARSVFHQISDGTTGPVAVKGASTIPVATDKALVVVLSPNQQAIPVSASPATSTAGIRGGTVILGGGTSGSINAIRATVYNEQSSNAQRSMSSSNVNDASAGSGARTVELVYYDSTGAGPFSETITLNGTTAVNTTATNICYIESLIVKTAGATGSNAGTITLFASTAGGGGAVASIGVGNLVVGQGDGRTLWAQHYVGTGLQASITGLVVGASSSSTFHVRAKPLSANAADIIVSGLITTSAAFTRVYGAPITIQGPARITMYGVPSTNGVTLSAAMDYFED